MKKFLYLMLALVLVCSAMCLPTVAAERAAESFPVKAEYVADSIDKAKYGQNELLDLEGVTLKLTYADGTVKEVVVGEEMKLYDVADTEMKNELSAKIYVLEPDASEEGLTLDKDGMLKLGKLGEYTVKAVYADGLFVSELEIPVTVQTRFMYVLPKAGIGMLGIFAVVLVMIATIYAVTIFSHKITNGRKKK